MNIKTIIFVVCDKNTVWKSSWQLADFLVYFIETFSLNGLTLIIENVRSGHNKGVVNIIKSDCFHSFGKWLYSNPISGLYKVMKGN